MVQRILEIEELHVFYGVIEALKGISFYVDKGEIVTLIGANGAGKSTILRAISHLLPYTGNIRLEGLELSRQMQPHKVARAGVTHIPEGRIIFGNLTVMENLELGAYYRSDKGIKDDIERVLTHFPRLKERLSQKGGTLSGGEQQMLAVARGMMQLAKIMLLDEPSMGLSPILVTEIFEILVDINKSGTTILLVEQNAHMALEIANRAYVLETGSITISGSAKDVEADKRVQEAYLG